MIIGTLTADAIVAWRSSPTAAGVGTTLLIAMLGLLATTPTDAVLLPRARSEHILLIGAIAIYGFAWTTGASATAAFVGLSVEVVLLIVCRRIDASAWWTALFAWQPLLVISMRHAPIFNTPG